MEIMLQVDPGPEAVRMVNTAFQDLGNVDRVLFTANKLQDGKMGRFIPETRSVILDCGNVMRRLDWVQKGLFVHHNVWYNLTYTAFHEACHAWQCLQEGWDAWPEDVDEEVIEREADERAIEKALLWISTNRIPTIGEMGWLGERVGEWMNPLFARGNKLVEEELRLMGTPAGGRADIFLMLHGGTESEENRCLLDRIDEGAIGCVVHGTRYLKAHEIIGGD